MASKKEKSSGSGKSQAGSQKENVTKVRVAGTQGTAGQGMGSEDQSRWRTGSQRGMKSADGTGRLKNLESQQGS